ncbi:MAG: OmpA family protein [Ignavibacterium sp.]|nr:OmpA family protein [Ignavibacterium sp.]
MKKLLLISAILVLILNIQAEAQFKDWSSKFGIRYNQIYPENEFRNVGFGGNDDFSFKSYYFSFLAEILYSVKLSDVFDAEFNLGYGRYAGDAYCNDIDQGDYKTTILPFDIRVKVNPFRFKSWNPFFYAGAGIMHYISHIKPEGLDCDFNKKNGWAGLFPLGLGSEFSLGKNFLLEFSLGGAFSTSYELDGFQSRTEKIWDSYLSTSIGFIYLINNIEKDTLVNNDFNKLKANPLTTDTDADGLPDFDEVNKYKTNPLEIDSDQDGLTDYQEIIEYKTNPINADTDSDGLTDFDEITKYKTDPLNPDSDGDGLSDSEEIFAYKTNPNNKDTDGGSIDDFTEVKRGTNPLSVKDDIEETKKQVFVFDNITFGFDKTNITRESEKILNNALIVLKEHNNILIEISGHTDNRGTKNYNKILSIKRAESVKEWLAKKGIDSERMTAIGFGMEKPIVPNTTKANRQKNRRCELKQTN